MGLWSLAEWCNTPWDGKNPTLGRFRKFDLAARDFYEFNVDDTGNLRRKSNVSEIVGRGLLDISTFCRCERFGEGMACIRKSMRMIRPVQFQYAATSVGRLSKDDTQ